MRLFEAEQYHTRYAPSTARRRADGKITVSYRRYDGHDERTWQHHVEGRHGLTVPPNLDDGTASWGAIDVDIYDMDLAALARRVERLRLSAFVVRTKSGGGRVLVFFDRRVPIADTVLVLRAICRLLDVPDRELFPSGVKERGTLPSGVNVPYVGHRRDGPMERQVAIRPGGGEIGLDVFLRMAERGRMGEDERARLLAEAPAPEPIERRRRSPENLHRAMPDDPELAAMWMEDLTSGRGAVPDEPEDDHLLKMECALAVIPADIPYRDAEPCWFKLTCVIADNCPSFEEGFAVLMSWSERSPNPLHRDPDENLKAWERACNRRKKATLNPSTVYHFADAYDPDRNWRAEYRRRKELGR